jgi:hypothetical protein
MLILAQTESEIASGFCQNMSSMFSLLGVFITIVKIVIPILLIVFGMLDMGKSVTSGKDDEIKKSAGAFARRVAGAVLVFFIPTIVGFVIYLIEAAGPQGDGTNDYCICLKSAGLGNYCK